MGRYDVWTSCGGCRQCTSSPSLKANLKIPEFGFLARAKDSTLERPSFRKLQALRFLMHADTRSSDETYARAKDVSHARARIERASSGDFQHPVLFAFLQTAQARKSTLERPHCFDKLARAKKATLERDPCFLKILKSVLKCIFASSFHSRHS
ncbi:hypothetical protein CsSME_00052462 [Camellia sinensis var. sinensis]